MAQATVTIKITPLELQVITEALKMLGYVSRHCVRDPGAVEKPQPLAGYQYDLILAEGDPRKLAVLAERIRGELGLR